MVDPAVLATFSAAAIPQQIVLASLAASIPAILLATTLVLLKKDRGGAWRTLIADMRFAGPVVGLLVGGLNGFHMAETITRLPFDPTLEQLAPGIFEISALLGLSGGVGAVALFAYGLVRAVRPIADQWGGSHDATR